MIKNVIEKISTCILTALLLLNQAMQLQCVSCMCVRVCAFYPEIVFGVVKEQPYFTVCMRQENLLQ